MVTDQIADLLTRIRNAQIAGHPSVVIPASTTKKALLALLAEQGYIAGIEEAENERGLPILRAMLRYSERGEPAIREMIRLSKPGRRLYVKKDEIPYNRGGLGTVIVSTSRGIVTDSEARKLGVGGELVCSIF